MSEPARPQNPTVAELSEVAYQTWRHHPITQGFLRFLADQAREYAGGVVDLWAAGRLHDPARNENADVLRGRYLALTEVGDLPLESMKAFYSYEDEPQQQEQDQKS